MGLDIVEQCMNIYSGRGDDHFQANQGFFIEASPVLLGSLPEGRVNRLRDIFQSDAFHGVTISQP
jgi:hypothetical protein